MKLQQPTHAVASSVLLAVMCTVLLILLNKMMDGWLEPYGPSERWKNPHQSTEYFYRVIFPCYGFAIAYLALTLFSKSRAVVGKIIIACLVSLIASSFFLAARTSHSDHFLSALVYAPVYLLTYIFTYPPPLIVTAVVSTAIARPFLSQPAQTDRIPTLPAVIALLAGINLIIPACLLIGTNLQSPYSPPVNYALAGLACIGVAAAQRLHDRRPHGHALSIVFSTGSLVFETVALGKGVATLAAMSQSPFATSMSYLLFGSTLLGTLLSVSALTYVLLATLRSSKQPALNSAILPPLP